MLDIFLQNVIESLRNTKTLNNQQVPLDII